MLEWLDAHAASGIINLILAIIPAAIIGFVVGLKKYTPKIKAALNLAFKAINAIDEIVTSLADKKISDTEYKAIGRKMMEAYQAYREVVPKK